ncbi:MAG TPA: TspO/MBR family protein [bacterium]|nr:TspO/MBR family protein [bacterium]
MKPFTAKDGLRLGISVVIPLAAGFIGSIFTAKSIPTWYAGLKKSALNPPDWVFAPVWTTLYVLMGIALFLVWSKGLATPRVRTGLVLFAIQLGLNVLWSIVFFGLRSPVAGLVVIGALWLALLITMIVFFRIALAPGLLLVPYILWVSFASVLNFSIYWLNR